MARYQRDEDILRCLNSAKKRLTAKQALPVMMIWGKKDDLTGGGMQFETALVNVEFYDANGNYDKDGTSTPDNQCAAILTMAGRERIMWVKAGSEDLLAKIPHQWRLFSLDVYGY